MEGNGAGVAMEKDKKSLSLKERWDMDDDDDGPEVLQEQPDGSKKWVAWSQYNPKHEPRPS